jgi:hypothetical protein
MSSEEHSEPEGGEVYKFQSLLHVRTDDGKYSADFAVQTVDNKMFVHGESYSRKFERILLKDLYQQKKRNKQTKELFGDMVEARDAEFKRLLLAKGCPIDEKKRRYGTKHVRCHVLTLPEICSIAVGDDHINVLCSRPNTKLWIEANSKCFDALATRLRVTIENAANPDGQIAPDVQHDNLINAGA